jgi:hypothetical protein
MCVPAQAASAGSSLAGQLVSSAFSAYGQIQQGQAQAAAARFNANQADQQAASTMTAARINEQQTYREGDQLEGKARAAMGANGVELNSGSALAVQQGIGQRTGQNVAAQDYNARLAQWGGLQQANMLNAQASNDTQAATIGAVGTMLSGASQVAGKWASFQQQGVFS